MFTLGFIISYEQFRNTDDGRIFLFRMLICYTGVFRVDCGFYDVMFDYFGIWYSYWICQVVKYMLEKFGWVRIRVVIIFQLLPNMHRYLLTKKLSSNSYSDVKLDLFCTSLTGTILLPLTWKITRSELAILGFKNILAMLLLPFIPLSSPSLIPES